MAQKLTHWKRLHNPNYIGAYALQPNEEPVFTIARVGMEMVVGTDGKKEECCVMHFQERDVKPMILNVTNSKTLERMYGTPYIEEWPGRKVQLYAAKVNAFGTEVEALRIRPKEPVAQKPELVPGTDKWRNAVQSVIDGNATIEFIKSKRTLSAENEEILRNEIDVALTAKEEAECLDPAI